MTSPLDADAIAKLLQEESQTRTRTSRGPRIDPTADRTLQAWSKLSHHLCHIECPHRVDPANPTPALE